MRKKRQMFFLAAARTISLLCFCLALTIVLVPENTASVSADAQMTLAQGEAVPQGAASLPTVGKRLIPLGRTTGIKLFSKGTMVVGFSDLQLTGNSPAKEGGLKIGDVLLSLNGREIGGNQDLTAQLAALQQEKAVFNVLRDKSEQLVTVTAAYDQSMQCYRIGAWIRDSIAGIGTVTFVDPDTGVFGALGHGICDADTGSLVSFGTGSVMASSVESVQKSSVGSPGQLCGSFDLLHNQGYLVDNQSTGIYGVMTNPALYAGCEAMDVAKKDEIKTGKATVISNIHGTDRKEYEIEIVRLYSTGGDSSRDMMIRVIDPELLSATGGIVQGMSGSPIVQNGKIVGAVTHVLVNDPTRGYAIAMETMLDTMNAEK